MDISPATPLDELLAEAAADPRPPHGTRVTYSPKVFIPLTMLCRDRCGYCTFAKPPARLELALPRRPTQVLAIARAGAAAGCHEALFTLGERPEERYPAAREWLADHGLRARPSTTWSPRAGWCSTRPGCCPTPTPAPSPGRAGRLRAVSPSPGHDAGVAGRPPASRRPTAGLPDKTPERRLATLEAAGELAIPFTTGILVGHRRDPGGAAGGPGGHRRLPPPPRPRAGGHRPELPAQAGHGHGRRRPALPEDEIPRGRSPPPGCSSDPSIHLQAPPNLSDDFGRPARRRHRRLGRRLAGHRRPRQPRAALARPRPAAGGDRGRRATSSPPGSPSTPSTPPTPTLARPRPSASRCSTARRRGPGPRRRAGPPAATSRRRRPARRRPDRPGGRAAPVGEVLAGVRAGPARSARTRSSPCSRPGARRSAAVAEVADDLRRQAVGDVVTFVAQPQHQLHQRLHVQVPVLRLLQGPAVAQPAGRPLPARRSTRSSAGWSRRSSCGATEVCLQGGIHPSFDGDYYLDVGRAVKAVAPTIHVHGFTALEVTEGARRLGEPLGRLPAPAQGGRPGDPARHRGRDPRRRGPGRRSAPTRSTPRSGSRPTGRPTRSGLRSNITIMFGHVEQPGALGPPPGPRPGTCRRRPAGSPSSCPCRSCTWPRRSTCSARPGRGPTFREALLMHAVGRIAYHGLDRQHPGARG